MINKDNFRSLLKVLEFKEADDVYTKNIDGHTLTVNFNSKKLGYPKGLTAKRDTTKDFSKNENFVVFECVHSLLMSGYKPEHIILEQGMPGGHGMTGGFCDIIVQDNNKSPYLLIECKTADSNASKEFSRAWDRMQKDGGQLFNYYNSYRQAQWLCLYCSDFNQGKLESNYYLISMSDNDSYLKSNEKLLSFKQVGKGGKEQYFKVWSETYQQDYISHNLFESEIFNIGSRPHSINDLKVVDNHTIQKKYHQFATIMRQHNVSARENAFDKLVNLFLCKVVDEKVNPDNLKVYWKGAASDSHYHLQDRLQQLYQKGMKDFLGEEVTYISEDEINKAFHLFKNKKDETKRTILEYFTQLKFYSNNPFAFLDVHNQKLFLQNAQILKEVVQMLQDIKLKNEHEQHQFLGDLFEGFLDQGVKQSEGQFFTPLPIVKFIVSSLPLKDLSVGKNIPKVIDYACGSGHFLTEYASQIKPILLAAGHNPSECYSHIYGIEKEYRLSKVAKVSAFMYGQDEMNIIYADALAQNQEHKKGEALADGSFSLLVANPPYSVKGFLSTLSEEDKKQFTLYNGSIEEEAFNAIETFFVEKAAKLLAEDGIAAIILPSSILTNGGVYIKCREILLKYFDLIAIAEFGSGTFGKTGTNTVTLFLRRKSRSFDLARHYQNRVNTWFEGDFTFDGLFEDVHLLKAYCAHCNFDFDDYCALLKAGSNVPNKVAEWEVFKEYRKLFDKKKHKKSTDLDKEWLAFTKAIEKDKLLFFMLAHDNKQDVLIMKMPSDNKEKKAFLGYEWSSAKGNEGIKYLTMQGGEDDTLANLKGINQIQTPLFNPNDFSDSCKINTLIRQNFLVKEQQGVVDIPDNLTDFVSLLPLTAMLDFERVEFDKAIRTSVQRKVEVRSKYDIVKLEDFPADIKKGQSITSKKVIPGKYKVVAGGRDFAYTHNQYNRDENTITISASGAAGFVNFWSEKIFASDCITVRAKTDLGTKFIYINLQSIQQNIFDLARGIAQPHVYSDDIKKLPIPLPPLDIQQKIVEECEKIDNEYENSRMKIEEYRTKISNIFNELEIIRGGGVNDFSSQYPFIRLNEICNMKGGDTFREEYQNGKNSLDIPFYKVSDMNHSANSRIMTVSNNYVDEKTLKSKIKASIFKINTLIFPKVGMAINTNKKRLLGRAAAVDNNIMAVWTKDENILNPLYLFNYFNCLIELKEIASNANPPSISLNNLGNIKIPLPPLNIQEQVVNEITIIQNQIAELEQQMALVGERKQAVLKHYL